MSTPRSIFDHRIHADIPLARTETARSPVRPAPSPHRRSIVPTSRPSSIAVDRSAPIDDQLAKLKNVFGQYTVPVVAREEARGPPLAESGVQERVRMSEAEDRSVD
jgi:hypothetical protein